MPVARDSPSPKVSITSWDYIKQNYHVDDRLAVVIRNQPKNQLIQRIDTARVMASPDFQRWLRFQNAQGGDVFVTVNALKPEATGRTRQDIDRIRHVYLDIDSQGPAVLARILQDPRIPRPNYVLNTSPEKVQVLWKVEHFSLEQAESLQRSMAAEFGADRAVVDAARVLRIPGFYNKKYVELHQVTAQRLSDELSRPEHFRIQAPEVSSDSLNGSRSAPVKRNSRSGIPEGAVSQSERDWAYAKRKLAQGVDPEEVVQAIRDYRPDKWSPELCRAPDYAEPDDMEPKQR
ncbi:MAG: DNA-primase RepB domain-containing protein [Acidobacteriota bacterium]